MKTAFPCPLCDRMKPGVLAEHLAQDHWNLGPGWVKRQLDAFEARFFESAEHNGEAGSPRLPGF